MIVLIVVMDRIWCVGWWGLSETGLGGWKDFCDCWRWGGVRGLQRSAGARAAPTGRGWMGVGLVTGGLRSGRRELEWLVNSGLRRQRVRGWWKGDG